PHHPRWEGSLRPFRRDTLTPARDHDHTRVDHKLRPFQSVIDYAAIAARVQNLAKDLDLASHSLAGPGAALASPGLRRRLETGSPAETVERLVSVVRLCGIDPTWLICGRFDEATHRIALEGTFRETWWLVQRLLIAESGARPGEQAERVAASSTAT